MYPFVPKPPIGRSWRALALAGIIVALVVGVLFTCNRARSGVSRPNQSTLDSLAATKPAYDSARVATLTSEHAGAVTSARQGATIVRYVAVASQEHRLADSLARAALATLDTAVSAWRAAYDSRTREADTLRVALDTALARVRTEQARAVSADRRASLDSARLVAVNKLNGKLVDDVQRAANCKVLRFIPCATRTQTFVVGGVVTLVVEKVVEAQIRQYRRR